MTPGAIATRFNDAINARDLGALVALMTDDHAFVDSAGSRVDGKDRCRDAWAGFFAAFPDYCNHFDAIVDRADTAIIRGRSECSQAALAGPALWVARARDGRLAEWRVLDDTPANRAQLGID